MLWRVHRDILLLVLRLIGHAGGKYRTQSQGLQRALAAVIHQCGLWLFACGHCLGLVSSQWRIVQPSSELHLTVNYILE